MNLSYLAVRGYQKINPHGVGKRPHGQLCMDRLEAMMETRLREMGLRE